MKKLTTIIALIISVNCFAQKDSIPPDSVEFISKNHIKETYKRLNDQLAKMEDKLTVTEYKRLASAIDATFGELIVVATEDYKKRKFAKPIK